MREFFHGWRRKAGCVALVMACLFMAGWVRSLSRIDLLTLATWNSFWRLTIEHGVVELSRYQYTSGDPPKSLRGKNGRQNSWTSESLVNPDGAIFSYGNCQANLATADTKTEFCGFAYATRKWVAPTFVVDTSFFVLQYRHVTIPLTLLSAYLILWPGKRPEKHPVPS